MGRPSKLTDETLRKLKDAVTLGATYELACKYAGITYASFRSWRAKPGPTRERLNAVLAEAEGVAALRWLGHIEQAAMQGNWAASAWKLERRYPQHYGRRERLDVHVEVLAQRVADELGLTPAEILAEAEALLAEADDGAAY